ncbi:MAG: ROK family transcriptional regulator [Dorea sp.]|nr:ROK family transcriptional regulator [Dorea sp.]
MKATTITPGLIKNTNRMLIYNLLYSRKRLSQQDIALELKLSRPTIATNLAEMERVGMIFKDGQLSSDQIGRKAVAYSIVPDYRVAIGVEIIQSCIKLIAINLYGKKMKRVVIDLEFSMTDYYYREVCTHIHNFIESLSFTKEQILGIGFSIQGLVSADYKRVIYGKILDCTGLTIDSFAQYLDYPCNFIHDSEASAITETWFDSSIQNAFILHLSYHLGAAIVQNGQIWRGKHGHNGTVEHITLHSNGPKCYCGKNGCAETFCSLKALLQGEDQNEFFQKVRDGEADAVERWQRFLTYLAELINMLHLAHDIDFVFSGYLSENIINEDLDFIYEKLRVLSPFVEAADFLKIGNRIHHSNTIGAALPYIKAFLEDLV